MGRPKEHGEETRSALLAEAGRILAEEGPEALTVRRLADAVQTTTRAVYSLFGGKEGLVSAMYWQMADTLVKLHAAVPEAKDPVTEIVPLTLAYRTSARTHPHLYPLIFAGPIPGLRPSEEALAHARSAYARVMRTIERAVALKRLKGRKAEDIGNTLRALVHGLAALELAGALGGAVKAERAWRDAVSTLLAGLATVPRDKT